MDAAQDRVQKAVVPMRPGRLQLHPCGQVTHDVDALDLAHQWAWHGEEVQPLADRVVVLDYGKMLADGTPKEVQSNQAVIDAYLGVAH